MSQGTDLTVFTAPTGDRLRVLLLDDQPWFVAQDVAAALDLANIRTSLALLDEDEKGVHSMDTPGGAQAKAIVSEPGLYALIMRSRRPEAKAFRRWVTHDVLPTIRRSGGYGIQAPALPATFAEALELAAKQARELEAAQKELAEARPNAYVVERLTASSGCLSFGSAGQALGFGRQTFIAHLTRMGMIMNKPGTSDHLRPYQNHLRAGRFEVETQTYEHPDEGTQVVPRTRVTPKGLVYIAKELLNDNKLPPRGKVWFAEATANKKESR